MNRNRLYLKNGSNWDEVYLNDTSIELNMAVADVESFGTKDLTYSNNIEILGSANNDRIFNYIFDLAASSTSIYLGKKVQAILMINNIQFDGVIELVEIRINKSINSSSYIVNFYDNTKSFLDIMGDKLIVGNDIASYDISLSGYNHTFTVTNILNTWAPAAAAGFTSPAVTKQSTFGAGYYYPLANIKNVNNTNTYNFEDLRPAIYIKSIWDAIFAKHGYTYTSTFLNSNYFKQLSTLTLHKVTTSQAELDARKVKVGLTADFNSVSSNQINNWTYTNAIINSNTSKTFDVTTNNNNDGKFSDESSFDFFDTNGLWGFKNIGGGKTGWAYTVPSGGLYKFSMVAEMDMLCIAKNIGFEGIYGYWKTDNDPPSRVFISIEFFNYRPSTNTTTQLTTSQQPTEVALAFDLNGQSFPQSSTKVIKTIQLQAQSFTTLGTFIHKNGDIVYPVVRINGNQFAWNRRLKTKSYDAWWTVKLNRAARATPSTAGTFFTVEALASDKTYVGDPVYIDKYLPSIKQYDFIKDIINAHNLYIQPDKFNPNNFIIDTRENYYASGTTITSWKIDLDSDIITTPVEEVFDKNLLFEYQSEDKSKLNAAYENTYEMSYGSLLIPNIQDVDETYKVTLESFAGTISAPIANTNIVIAQVCDSTGSDVDKMPRYVFRQDIPMASSSADIHTTVPGTQGLNKVTLLENTTGAKYVMANWITTCGEMDTPYKPTYSLSWGDNKYYYQKFYNNSSNPPTNNLYNQFWLDYFDSFVSTDARLITAQFNISEEEIYKFNFNDKIALDGNSYLVNRITFRTDNLSEVQLIRINE